MSPPASDDRPPAPDSPPGALARARRWLLGSGWGRGLAAASCVELLGVLGAVPEPARTLARLVLAGYAAAGLWRAARGVTRRLLWRIRTKLIVSYLFIAVVPLVLLAVFFLSAGFLTVGLVANHMVEAELELAAERLQGIARVVLAGLDVDSPDAARVLARRLAEARALHPGLSWALLVGERFEAGEGGAARTVPEWLGSGGFAGLVRREDGPAVVRALWREGSAQLVLDAPLDRSLFASVEARTGVRILADLRALERGDLEELERLADREGEAAASLWERWRSWFSVPGAVSWASGTSSPSPLLVQFRPADVVRRLSAAPIGGGAGMADRIVQLLYGVGVAFLVVYSGALVLGWLLARSITRSVHALSVGTERLRQGDFAHRIQVRSRDQLGDLAESFNVMGQGLEELLRQRAERERLEEELRIAREIQMRLLPQGAVEMPGLQVAALCLPATEVGGDYYDLIPLSDARLALLVADVSGKGTSAALYMAELKGLVLSLSGVFDSPRRLLCEANRILAGTMDSRTFITMTYAVVDVAGRSLRFSRAGHNPLIHLDAASRRARTLAPPGLGLGIDRGERFDEVLEERELPLASGDLFLFFTDGLSEAMNEAAELYGEARLRELVERHEGLDSEEIRERILRDVKGFAGGAAQHDDLTLVVLKVVGDGGDRR